MQDQEFQFEAFKTSIFGRYVEPGQVSGVVVLVHGFGEHSGRYAGEVVPMLLDTGLAVVLYDNVGHGKSGGKRGHCPSYEALLDILGMVIDMAETRFPEMPLFLYGHSMGGNLVLNYVMRRKGQLAGVVATSPYLRLAFQPPQWKMFMGRVLMHIMPSITMPSGLDPKGISRIPEEVGIYQNDPLVHDKVSPMYSLPIMEAGEWAISNADQMGVEALLLHGTGDPIIDYRATVEFHQNSNKTTLKLYEGGYHELHHDHCKEEVLEIIGDWFKNRV